MPLRVKYFIPEDGDEFDHPNIFMLSKERNVTLRDIREAFPVPGVYHFRILQAMGNTKVWMDLVDDSEPISSGDSAIFAKVSRIRYPDGDVMGAGGGTGKGAYAASSSSSDVPSSSATGSSHAQAPAQEASNLVDFEDFADFGDAAAPTTAPTAAAAAAPMQQKAPQSDPVASSASMGGSGSEGDLLGFDSGPSASSHTDSTANLDLFGFDGLQATPVQTPMMQQPMNPMGAMGGGAPMGGPLAGGGPAARPAMQQRPPQPLGGGGGGGGGGYGQRQQQPKDAFSDLWKK